jgi:hypothetical protein
MLHRICASQDLVMLDADDFTSDLNQERVAALELRYRHTLEAMVIARTSYDTMQGAEQIDELQLRRSLGSVQWLQGQLADLQEAVDRLRDGVCA